MTGATSGIGLATTESLAAVLMKGLITHYFRTMERKLKAAVAQTINKKASV